jgi:hypothetical protein
MLNAFGVGKRDDAGAVGHDSSTGEEKENNTKEIPPKY